MTSCGLLETNDDNDECIDMGYILSISVVVSLLSLCTVTTVVGNQCGKAVVKNL